MHGKKQKKQHYLNIISNAELLSPLPLLRLNDMTLLLCTALKDIIKPTSGL